jgi:hypothetical protein
MILNVVERHHAVSSHVFDRIHAFLCCKNINKGDTQDIGVSNPQLIALPGQAARHRAF